MTINRNNYESFMIDYLDGTLSPEVTADLLLFLQLNPDIAAEVEGLQNDAIPADYHTVFSLKNSLKKSEIPLSEDELDSLLFNSFEGTASQDERSLLANLLEEFPSVAKQFEAMNKAKWVASPEVYDLKEGLRFPEFINPADPTYQLVALLEGDLSRSAASALETEINNSQVLAEEWKAFSATKLKPNTEVFENKKSLYRKTATVIPLRRAFYYVAAASAILFVALFWKQKLEPANVAVTIEQILPANPDTSEPLVPSAIPPSNELENSKPQPEKKQILAPAHAIPNNGFTPEDVASNTAPNTKRMIRPNNAQFKNAGRSTGEIAPVSKIVVNIPDSESLAQVAKSTKPKEIFPTILEFAEEKAREKFLGKNDQTDPSALALVEKGVRKITGDEDAVVENNDGSYKLKLGKFEISRNKGH